MSEQPDAGRPVLRVVRGEPTAEELAALVAVAAVAGVRAAAAGEPGGDRRPRSAWNHPARLVRRPVAAGPGGWRRSALPG